MGVLDDQGGPLTAEAFNDFIQSIREERIRHRPSLVVHPQTVKNARANAQFYAAVSRWCDMELDATPWWRWIKRRELLRDFFRHADYAESLWRVFGTGEEKL